MKELHRIPEARAKFGAKITHSAVYDELARREEQSKEGKEQLLEKYKQALNKKRNDYS